MSTRVYGASDDLVELEGDLNGEVSCYQGDVLVAFSDGTVLRIQYGKPSLAGVWQIIVLNQGLMYDRFEECHDEDGDPYSDQVFFVDGKLKAWAAKIDTDDDCVVN